LYYHFRTRNIDFIITWSKKTIVRVAISFFTYLDPWLPKPITTRMAVKKSKYKTGWRLLLIKAICAVAIVFILEKILDLFTNADPLGAALLPFHNHYFSFSRYYLTNLGMGSDFTDDPSATNRFVMFFILGYVVYVVINTAVWLLCRSKTKAASINSWLYYLMVLIVFLLAFYFPGKITVIDTAKKEIRITTYTYFFIPATTHIPFNAISTIGYNTARDYDGYNKKYINYLMITVTNKTGIKTQIGEIQAGEEKGTLVHKPAMVIPQEKSALADRVVGALNKVVAGGGS
jgi:hypothetical protein